MSGQINLYNPALRRQTDLLGAGIVMGTAALLLAGVSAASVWTASAAREAESLAAGIAAQLKTANEKLEELKKQAERKPNPALAAELVTAQDTIKERTEILSMLSSSAGATQGFAEYFRGLARQAPNGLWLTGFSIGAGGAEMEIRGRTLNATLLPEYIRRLNSETAFHGRGFAALTLRQMQEERKPAADAKPDAKSVASTGPRIVEFTLDPVKIAAGKGGKGGGLKDLLQASEPPHVAEPPPDKAPGKTSDKKDTMSEAIGQFGKPADAADGGKKP